MSTQITVCSSTYDGSVRVGFRTDASCAPEPERLLRAFDKEISGLLRLSHAM